MIDKKEQERLTIIAEIEWKIRYTVENFILLDKDTEAKIHEEAIIIYNRVFAYAIKILDENNHPG